MRNETETETPKSRCNGFQCFATKQMALAVFFTLFGLWLVGTILGLMAPDQPTASHAPKTDGHTTMQSHGAENSHAVAASGHAPASHGATTSSHMRDEVSAHILPGNEGHIAVPRPHEEEAAHAPAPHGAASSHAVASSAHAAASSAHAAASAAHGAAVAGHAAQPEAASHAPAGHGAATTGHGAADASGHPAVTGWRFVQAAIEPMDYELNERFWGWRPNDLIRPTDNVNNFQLGVLEVTRRTAVKLAEDISRTGSTASFDKNLEQAMNWFMIRPEKFWFPSAESKYKSGLKEFRKYQEKLVNRQANFYTRSDNLIPLLIVYKNLLGSCDENLVKQVEDDGTHVSFFKSDDYFFYAQGVASAMATILEAVHHDFYPILETRHGLESLHHAVESCKHAGEIDPFIVLNSDLSGMLANHRANLATRISHARFYLGVLITTLST